MIKRKLKLAGALLAVAGALCLASCGSNSSANNQPVVNSTDDINEKVETKQKYVIELNMENYQKYIDIRFIPSNNGSSSHFNYYFQGSLSYAYYDNVVITSHYSRTGYEETDTEISLTTGGYARWYSTGGYGTTTLTGVRGKVIYWI